MRAQIAQDSEHEQWKKIRFLLATPNASPNPTSALPRSGKQKGCRCRLLLAGDSTHAGDKCASNPQWDNEPLELKHTLVCWACLPLVDNSLRLRSKPCVNPRPWTKDAQVRRTKFCISQATRTYVQHLPISSSSLSNCLLHPFSSISIHPLLFCPLCRKNGCSSSRATRKRGETWRPPSQRHFGLLHRKQPAMSKKGPLVRAPRTMSQPRHAQTQQRTASSRPATKLQTKRMKSRERSREKHSTSTMWRRWTGWPRCWPLLCHAPQQQATVPWCQQQGFGVNCKPR